MDIYQLMEIAVSLSNRLDTHWTLFITVHLALIGGIIYVDRPLQKFEKIAAILVYSGFALINYLMMLNQINFLNSLYMDIVTFATDPCCKDSQSVAYISRMQDFGGFKSTNWVVAAIHIAMYVLVIVSILNDKARSTEATSADNQPEELN